MTVDAVVHLLRSCLLVLTALFPIVNPLGNSPIFLSLTPGFSGNSRALLARSIALNSFWLLTGSMLIGGYILDFFGISIPVVQIGGGLVVMSTGWALLKTDGKSPPDEEMGRKLTPQDIADRAFFDPPVDRWARLHLGSPHLGGQRDLSEYCRSAHC